MGVRRRRRVSGRACRRRLAGMAVLVAALVLPAACGPEAPLVDARMVDAPSPFGYPVSLWDEGASGETVLLVHVTVSGEVDSVTVAQSSGRLPFDSAALADGRKLRFIPAHRGGDRVPTWVRVPVRFSRDSAAAAQPDSAAELPPDSATPAPPDSGRTS